MSKFNILTIKSPIKANGQMKNGKFTYSKNFVTVGYKNVYMVSSKVDGSILFESTVMSQIENFCATTNLL